MRLFLLFALLSILVTSLLPGYIVSRIPLQAAHLTDKDAHFLEYALLAFLSVLAFVRPVAGLACALCAVPLGVALEFAQKLVPGRSCDVHDMLANTMGVATGILLAFIFRRFSSAPSAPPAVKGF